MNVIQAIDSLRNDLDRTIESLEALRNGFATYALLAPDVDKPNKPAVRVELDDRVKDGLKRFVDENLTAKENAFARCSALWAAYIRWCRFNDAKPVTSHQFTARLRAIGITYSRSRRIAGQQARTWEGVALRKRSDSVQ